MPYLAFLKFNYAVLSVTHNYIYALFGIFKFFAAETHQIPWIKDDETK